jgi:nicotinate-nucleotide adenylyltransferase
MKVGLFGGVFDPVHRGHLEPVIEARRQLELDVVYFLPTARPPHKGSGPWAPPLARYAMVELALLHLEGLEARTWELTLGRTAYTVETVERCRRELPAAELFLLVGADSLAALPTWRRWRDLLELVRLAVLRRPGWCLEGAPQLAPELLEAQRQGRLSLVNNVAHDLSSTVLRAQLARGDTPAPGAIPPLVLDYLHKYKLYDEKTGPF